MNKVKLLLGFGLILISFLAGCADKPTEYIDQACLAGTNKRSAMSEAEDVLRKMHFTIEKADVEYGYISTKPLRGAQSFELWRSDNIGEFNSAEANLHTIRRSVEMNFTEQSGQMCVECIARVERMSLPEREVVSPSNATDMFTKSRGSSQRLKLHPEQAEQMRWIDLGRDGALETEILNRIKHQL